MNKIIIATLFLGITSFSFGQKSQEKVSNTNTLEIKENPSAFNNFCLETGSYYVEVPKKKEVAYTGEISSTDFSENKNYSDYSIDLKDEETQYFSIQGSSKMLVVKSIYVLRIEFSNLK